MKHVTRDIDPDTARDLLERVPRARIAFTSKVGPQAEPVMLVYREGRYLAGIRRSASYLPSPGEEAVLLVDEGVYYFELRAIYIRGRVKLTEAPAGAMEDRMWFEIEAVKTIAWDYGSMREVRNASA